ncbi:hypothetical protein FRC09_000659 [Ceratobasidium sp. 395]|nr:hypothetical protein FRC09_000659 [Ceratobasidium sp. 395]
MSAPTEVEYAQAQSEGGTRKRVSIVTCMDHRIQVQKIIDAIHKDEQNNQLDPKNCDLLRNAGGRSQEALRSIIVGQSLLRTSDVHVVHHTGCGMDRRTEVGLRLHIAKSIPNNPLRMHLLGQHNFLPLHNDYYNGPDGTQVTSVEQDCRLIASYPLIKPGTKVTGWIYTIGEGNGTDRVDKVEKVGQWIHNVQE